MLKAMGTVYRQPARRNRSKGQISAKRRVDSTREVAVYDGRDCLGKIAIAANKKARAFDSRGKSLGTFENFEAASAALRTFASLKHWVAP
jgi:hypothetical protein